MNTIPAHERLIVALDVPSANEARALVVRLGDAVAFYKIGMELLTRIQKETDGFAKIEQYPKLEGRQMMMVLAPR